MPEWFLNLSLIFQLLLTIISLGIGIVSLRINSYCKSREYKLFGAGFILIALSYVFWTGLNLFVLTRIREGVEALELTTIATIGAVMLYTYFLLFIIGLITLTYLNLDIKGIRAYLLLVALGILPVILSTEKALAFFIITALLILFMTTHYLRVYQKKKTVNRLMTLSAFALLFISRIDYFYSNTNHIHYVLGHSIEIIAYLLLLINLVLAMKKASNPQKRVRNKKK
ncbi:hypothetical protein COU61_02365 [Candidatus Pacearchaeota archaeon CG10_big_fil_rev_8_21_14_0_10_35_13]|nr:MAG: hypothetical protein COU61_02365 [Candidatus Pacearchaeota archaeon CG10_big_fil_rev_8_21_14_0_10_35_13]